MALVMYFLLATVAVFALIASGPLIAQVYHGAREDVAAGGWPAALGLIVRGFFWVVALLPVLWLILIGGMFV